MILTILWLLLSLFLSIVYVYSALPLSVVLEDPGQFGDVLAGLSAFVSLPSILILLIQNNKDEKRKNKEFSIDVYSRQLQTDMNVFEHLNHQFDEYGYDIKYMLENKSTLKPKVTWDHWDNKDNVFAYIKAAYFSGDAMTSQTLDIISKEKNIIYVCDRFCTHVFMILNDLKRLNKDLGRGASLIQSIQKHPVCIIAMQLEKICEKSSKAT